MSKEDLGAYRKESGKTLQRLHRRIVRRFIKRQVPDPAQHMEAVQLEANKEEKMQRQ